VRIIIYLVILKQRKKSRECIAMGGGSGRDSISFHL